MRVLCRILLVLGTAVLLAGPFPGGASGEDAGRRGDRGRGGRGGDGFGLAGPMLLLNKGVQQELKLTDEQVDKLRKAVREARAGHKEEFQQLAETKDRRERAEKWQKLVREIREETRKTVADVLNDDQERRLKEIQRQQLGILAFADPEVQEALKLSDEQKEKLKGIGHDATEDFREIFQRSKGDLASARTRLRELRTETLEKAMGVLDENQRKTWRELTGKPFEVQPERQPGRRPERNREEEK